MEKLKNIEPEPNVNVIIDCWGCGSKWSLPYDIRNEIIAELVECPLCKIKEEKRKNE